MLLFISKIENLFEKFGRDNSLSNRENISVLAQKFLIDNLKKQNIITDYTICRTEKGKPYFANEDGLFFSVSHTNGYIAVCVDKQEIGLDIESLRTDKINIAQRFFHQKEKKYLDSLADEEKDAAFTQLWTIKEAYVKMTGRGIADNFDTVDLSPEEYLCTQNYVKQDAEILSQYSEEYRLFVSIVRRK